MIGPVTTSDEFGISAGLEENAAGVGAGDAGFDAGAAAAFVVDGAIGRSSLQPTASINAPNVNATNALFILDMLTSPSNPTASTQSKCKAAAAKHIPRDKCRF